MSEISAEIWAQLDEAQAALEPLLDATGPMLPAEATMPEVGDPLVGAGGCAVATNLMLDHYFTSPLRRVYANASGAWRYRNVTATEETGLMQVAFAADQVVVCWDASNQLTIIRCVKTF
jgi:hypothetical protein